MILVLTICLSLLIIWSIIWWWIISRKRDLYSNVLEYRWKYFCDINKVVLPSPGSGEKWQSLLLPCRLYIIHQPCSLRESISICFCVCPFPLYHISSQVKPPCLCICLFFERALSQKENTSVNSFFLYLWEENQVQWLKTSIFEHFRRND